MTISSGAHLKFLSVKTYAIREIQFVAIQQSNRAQPLYSEADLTAINLRRKLFNVTMLHERTEAEEVSTHSSGLPRGCSDPSGACWHPWERMTPHLDTLFRKVIMR